MTTKSKIVLAERVQEQTILHKRSQFLSQLERALAGLLAGKKHLSYTTDKGTKQPYFHYIPYTDSWFLNLLDIVKKHGKFQQKYPEPTFLDVGCGFGLKVFLAHQAGFIASGVEYCKKYAEIAKKTSGSHNHIIMQGDALDFKSYKDFDVIYAYRPIANAELMNKLTHKVVDEMKVGAYIIGSWGYVGEFEDKQKFKIIDRQYGNIYQKVA